MTSYTLGFDIGGTNLRGAVVDASGHICAHLSVPTPLQEEALEAAIGDLAHTLCGQWSVTGVGVAIAGFLDRQRATVRFAPHLAWRNAPVRARLEELLGLPVVLSHDADAAGWAEYRFGAVRGEPDWVYLSLGTGIGGAAMIDGELFRGGNGVSLEFGHLPVARGGHARPCPCGKRGCLERYCSGTALVDTARELGFVSVTGETSGRAVTEAARRGEQGAVAAVGEVATWLGYALAMVADIIDPPVIVVGGGLAGEGDLLLPRARAVLAEQMVGSGFRPVPAVVTAQLRGDAGVIGAADLARTMGREYGVDTASMH